MTSIPFFAAKGVMNVMVKSFTVSFIGSPLVELVRGKIPKIPYQIAQISTVVVASGVACYFSYDENTEWPGFVLSSLLMSYVGSKLAEGLLDLEPRPSLQGRVKKE
jgi:hypothetical protein